MTDEEMKRADEFRKNFYDNILTVKKLKEMVASIDEEYDNAPVLIPIVDDEDSAKHYGYRIVSTAGIIHEDGEINGGDALLIAPGVGGADVSELLKYNHRDNDLFGTTCKKVLF